MPTPVPMRPERRMVRQYWKTSRSLGMTVSKALMVTGAWRARMLVSSSAKPKAPTSAGTSWMPPARSRRPQAKRS